MKKTKILTRGITTALAVVSVFFVSHYAKAGENYIKTGEKVDFTELYDSKEFSTDNSKVTLSKDNKTDGLFVDGKTEEIENARFMLSKEIDFSDKSGYLVFSGTSERKRDVTLSLYLDDSTKSFAKVKLAEKLMKRGCHVAIDDFGKEESNLLRLMQMPFSVLKIDKAVVWTIDTTSFSKDLISEIIYFLHKYGIQITAEGIENQLQAKELSDMGCDFLQGYLISKPVSFKDFCAFIDAHNKKGSAEMKETPEEKGKNEPQKRKMKKSNIPYDFPVLAE